MRTILNAGICDPNSDVAIAAARKARLLNIEVDLGVSGVNAAGVRAICTKRATRHCGFHIGLKLILGSKVKVLRWRLLFKEHYPWAEQQILLCANRQNKDPSAFVNALDALLDMLLHCLYRLDSGLGVYQVGNIGSVLHGGRLRSSYPDLYKLVDAVHNERSKSRYSHPVTRVTKRRTRSISSSFVERTRRLLRAALDDFSKLIG